MRRLNEVENQCALLNGCAARLREESAAWQSADTTEPAADQRRAHIDRMDLLWAMALVGGAALMRLAIGGHLSHRPRLQTLAHQVRSELRRHVDEGTLPSHPWWPGGGWRHTGLDLRIVQLFDQCQQIWFGGQDAVIWYGREREVAAAYARFMSELSGSVGHGPGAPPAEHRS